MGPPADLTQWVVHMLGAGDPGPVAVTSWAAADEEQSAHHTCPYTAHPATSHQTFKISPEYYILMFD